MNILSKIRFFLISVFCFFHKKYFFKKLNIFDVHFELLLNLENGYVDKEFLVFGIYEKEIFLLIKKLSSKQKNFLDVGSNIGQYANFSASLFNKVFAFEPIKRIYDQNQKSLIKNSFFNVSLFNLALGAQNLSSYIYQDSRNIGASSIYKCVQSSNDICEAIHIVSGDSILEDPIHLIKIDVEGYELNVLEGCRHIINHNRPDLILEYSPDFYNRIDLSIAGRIVSFLREFGYIFYIIKKDKIQKIDALELPYLKRENIFCTVDQGLKF